jgi:hypothetical protein
VAAFVQRVWVPLRHFFPRECVVTRNEYDPNSAVTFLLLGLGIGTIVAIVCNPRIWREVVREGTGARERPGIQPQRQVNHRVA